MIDTIKKVVVVGPECTGKSELSEFLAGYFNTAWVPEYARQYLDSLSRPYYERDLLTIARGQVQLEDDLVHNAQKLLICDTNLYVIKVWSEFKYGQVDPEILEEIKTRRYDLYMLTHADLPWEDDPLREHPHKRHELFEIYRHEMLRQPVPFVEIKGDRAERRGTAIAAIEKMFAG